MNWFARNLTTENATFLDFYIRYLVLCVSECECVWVWFNPFNILRCKFIFLLPEHFFS